MSIIEELKRRNVIRVVLTYVVAGWLLIEGMDLLTDAFEAPAWVIKMFIGVVALGVLPTAIIAWVYEITPEGIQKDSAGRGPSAPASGHKLNIAIAVMLAVAIGLYIEQRVNREVVAPVATQSDAQPASSGPPMVAVLPFVSASLSGDSEFFAVGVHDDLLTQLAQIHSIRVISRTSVLEYRDTVRNIRDIGRELGADAILEGGVQSAGSRIRINAQLIDAKTDEHLWAETYDRDLSPSSIFEVQTEIAHAIAFALRATLTQEDETQLTVIPTENMAAYRAYRRAMQIRDESGAYPGPYRDALEEAVALDPMFTRAWAELAGNLSFEQWIEENTDTIPRIEEIIESIRELAPNSADLFIGQAFYNYYVMRDLDQALQFITKAQSLRPSDVRVAELKSWIQRRLGDYDGMIETVRVAQKVDPRNPRWTWHLVRSLTVSHRYEEAEAEASRSTFRSYQMLTWQSLLEIREHGDIGRWARNIAALQMEFEGDADVGDLFEALIANRDFDAVDALLNAHPELFVHQGPHAPNLSIGQSMRIINDWFQGRTQSLQQDLREAREHLEKSRDPDGQITSGGVLLDMTLVAAAEGNRPDTEIWARRWLRWSESDLAEQVYQRAYICQGLGMAGAAAAAVDCIRAALDNPSKVMPFLEPLLPYYDSIRDEPEFVELQQELGY